MKRKEFAGLGTLQAGRVESDSLDQDVGHDLVLDLVLVFFVCQAALQLGFNMGELRVGAKL